MKHGSLKQRLRFHRRRWALLQKQIAHLLGISVSAIARYEGGARMPNLKAALKYEVLFGTSVRELLEELYEQLEEEVLGKCAKLYERLEGRMTASAIRKRALLEEVMKRARRRIKGDDK